MAVLFLSYNDVDIDIFFTEEFLSRFVEKVWMAYDLNGLTLFTTRFALESVVSWSHIINFCRNYWFYNMRIYSTR